MGENTPEGYVPEHRADETEPKPAGLSGATYDKLKFLAMIVLPAVGAAYFSLGDLWDLPKIKEVVGTCSILAIFLGTILGISSSKFKNDPRRFAGKVQFTGQINPETGEPDVLLMPKQDPKDWEGKKEVTFKVVGPR